jgi:hypothetical protein
MAKKGSMSIACEGGKYVFRVGRLKLEGKNLQTLKVAATRAFAGQTSKLVEVQKTFDDFLNKKN